MEQQKELKTVILEYIAIFDQLIHFENQKLDAISDNDVVLLEALMKDEQAYILKLKGLDRKRQNLQDEMNMSNLTLSEMISTLKGDVIKEFNGLYELLTKRTEELKSATDTSKQYIELRLYSINLLITNLGGESKLSALYDKRGTHEVSAVSHFTSKKV